MFDSIESSREKCSINHLRKVNNPVSFAGAAIGSTLRYGLRLGTPEERKICSEKIIRYSGSPFVGFVFPLISVKRIRHTEIAYGSKVLTPPPTPSRDAGGFKATPSGSRRGFSGS
jgi:hypothetical protein